MGRIGYWISEAFYAMLFGALLVVFLLISLVSAVIAAVMVLCITPELLVIVLFISNIIKYKIDH